MALLIWDFNISYFTVDVYFIFRVFTFGIGSGASTALVNGLAKAGKGTSEFIKEGERMQPKASIKIWNYIVSIELRIHLFLILYIRLLEV